MRRRGQHEANEQYWRVFYTFPRAEKQCEQRLHDQKVDVFLPKMEVVRQWTDRKKKVVEPLFRSYIFAHVNERDRIRVLRTDGIVRCVSFGGRPAEVPEEEIEQLKITQKGRGRLSLADTLRPSVGEQVTVMEGPMQGLSGTVIEHRGGTYIVVQVASIRQAVKVHVPAEWVSRSRSAA